MGFEPTTRVPAWIRKFACPSWTNVFHLCPNTQSLFPMTLRAEWKSQFNDWSGKTLLLAKDGCPPEVIHKRIARGEPQPWRYGERERGDELGWRTNDRLFGFASRIPGGKLYSSAAANMLYNEPAQSNSYGHGYSARMSYSLCSERAGGSYEPQYNS